MPGIVLWARNTAPCSPETDHLVRKVNDLKQMKMFTVNRPRQVVRASAILCWGVKKAAHLEGSCNLNDKKEPFLPSHALSPFCVPRVEASSAL